MRLLFLVLLFLCTFSCSTNQSSYWCGDHACINKKEKEDFFKKNMTVEIKQTSKINKKMLQIDLIKEKYGVADQNNNDKEKELLLKKSSEITNYNEKELVKQIKTEKKRRLKEQKELTKQLKIEEKIRKKEEKKLAKKTKLSENKLKKEEYKINTNNTAKGVTESEIYKLSSSSNSFKDLVNNIIKKNNKKSYPDINNINIK